MRSKCAIQQAIYLLKVMFRWIQLFAIPEHRCNDDFMLSLFTLQEMCCGFLLSREMWYRKSVLPGTGAG